jgi:hypothetical protein
MPTLGRTDERPNVLARAQAALGAEEEFCSGTVCPAFVPTVHQSADGLGAALPSTRRLGSAGDCREFAPEECADARESF